MKVYLFFCLSIMIFGLKSIRKPLEEEICRNVDSINKEEIQKRIESLDEQILIKEYFLESENSKYLQRDNDHKNQVRRVDELLKSDDFSEWKKTISKSLKAIFKIIKEKNEIKKSIEIIEKELADLKELVNLCKLKFQNINNRKK